MSDVSQWATSAASNNDAAPDGWPEGQAPSTVNDCGREVMAAVARWYSDTDGTLTDAGTANVRTLTTNSTHAALADQSLLVFRSSIANTGATTLNVDSLGAKAVRINGNALTGGELKADKVVAVAYNATDDAYDIIGMSPVDALAKTDGGFIVGDGTNFVIESGATARTSLGLGDTATKNEAALAINTDQLTTDYANADTSTAYTVGSGDAESIRRFTSSSAITITLPNSTPTGWAVGDSMGIIRGGTGTLTFSSAGTIRTPGGSAITVQHGKAVATLAASGVWELSGYL